LLPTHHF